MNNSITIILPPPDSRLHAHAKGHWRPKAAATKQLRQMAHMMAKQASRGQIWASATIEYRFLFPDFRRRDQANAIHAMKAAVDGVVDSGLIPDDDWTHLRIVSVICDVDRKRPRTEMVFREDVKKMKTESTRWSDRITQWAADRNLIDGSTPADQMKKLYEEVEELAEGIDLGIKSDIVDAIGDIQVVLAVMCTHLDLDIDECREAAWNEIKDRTGKMVDGMFVKDS